MTGPLPAVQAFAPGSVGNVGPGLDILGLAVAGAGDTVIAQWVERPGIHLLDPGHPDLPREAEHHAAGIAAAAVLLEAGPPRRRSEGVGLVVRKGLPLSGGQGGSAASAVAGAVATNALLGASLDRTALMRAALVAEERVAGRHLDNIAPSLLGGIVLIRSMEPLDVVPLPVPAELVVVLVCPDQRMRTEDARGVLPEHIPRAVALHQAAQVGALISALASADYGLLGRAIDDRIAEPARSPLLPGFREAKAAALSAGALGCSISGSGPTAFALARGRASAEQVALAMVGAYSGRGQPSEARIAPVDQLGARLIHGVDPP